MTIHVSTKSADYLACDKMTVGRLMVKEISTFSYVLFEYFFKQFKIGFNRMKVLTGIVLFKIIYRVDTIT